MLLLVRSSAGLLLAGVSVGSYSRGHRNLEQVHGHGLVTRPVPGAVQARVHGLVGRVRDGVLLVVLRGLRPCEHAAQVAAVRSDDSGCASPSVHRQSWTLQLCHSDRCPPRTNCAEDR